MKEALRDRMIRHEGLRLKPYRDQVNKLTIGVGRNLDDSGISESEALAMLDNDIARCRSECATAFFWFYVRPVPVQEVLVEMAFQMGIAGLKQFRETLHAIEAFDYRKAAECMRQSQWHSQTPSRAEELSKIIEAL